MNMDYTPQLGSHDQDNSPMIGTQGAPIPISARDAYLMGDLTALVGLMEGPQQTFFRITAARYAFSFVVPMIDADPALLRFTPYLMDAFYALRQTLELRSQADFERLAAHLRWRRPGQLLHRGISRDSRGKQQTRAAHAC